MIHAPALRRPFGFILVATLGLGLACSEPPADPADAGVIDGGRDAAPMADGGQGPTDGGADRDVAEPEAGPSDLDSGPGVGTDAGTDGGVDGGGWWAPPPNTSWQWQLSGAIDTSFDVAVYDLDLFDTPQATIDALHGAGRRVICYFDTAYEPNRPDSPALEPFRGNPIDVGPGQCWPHQRAPEARVVMAARLAAARAKGCDEVEPDDVDAIDTDPGLPLTAADQLDFCRFLALEAHARGLGVGLKNNLGQVSQLLADFDFAVNEECFAYEECDALSAFIADDKAVFQVEYTEGNLDTKAAQICPMANALNFDTLIKHLELGPERRSCR